MKTMREQFEKLPEIAKALNANGGGFYKELTNSYHHTNTYYDKFINGAWYAFQEQQKKIDSLGKLINRIYSANEDSEIKSIIDGWDS